jgi:hypothetical protein
MKQISILAVFLVAFLGIKAQVNPETFPTVTPVETDNVYSQTGGVTKKFLLSDIARLARNGVNGQDSAGLGGSLNQNTTIFMGGFSWYNWSVMPNPFGGSNFLGWAHNINGCNKNISTASYNNLHYNTIQTGLDTCDGTLHTELAYGNIGTGMRKQFVAKYSSAQQGELFINLYAGDGSGGLGNDGINILFDDTNFGSKTAMRFVPENTYTGDLMEVRGAGIGSFFRLKNNGKMQYNAPAYNDDADAGTNGLVTGDTYQTSATNTLGLPQGVLMIKQ